MKSSHDVRKGMLLVWAVVELNFAALLGNCCVIFFNLTFPLNLEKKKNATWSLAVAHDPCPGVGLALFDLTSFTAHSPQRVCISFALLFPFIVESDIQLVESNATRPFSSICPVMKTAILILFSILSYKFWKHEVLSCEWKE